MQKMSNSVYERFTVDMQNIMINFEFNFWDSLFSILSILIGTFVSVYLYKISKNLSAKDKYEHELKISRKIGSFPRKYATTEF